MIDKLAKFGGIGVALFAIYVLWNLLGNHVQETNKVIQGNTQAFLQQTISNEKMANALDKLTKAIERTAAGSHFELLR